MVLLTLALGCRREPIEDKETDAALNVSTLQSNVIRLDTLIFINPTRTNGQVRFDLIGTPPQIVVGNMVYYPGDDGLYGRVSSVSIAGSRVFFQIEKAAVDQLFKSIVIQDDVSKNQLRSLDRVEPARWNSDTMNLQGFVLFDDFRENRRLVVQFDSGKLFTSADADRFSLAGQGANPWFDRLGLVSDYSLDLSAGVKISTAGPMETTDSVQLKSAVYGPFLVNGVPITYRVDTWVGFHILSHADTLFTMKVNAGTKGNLTLKYNYWEDWGFSRNNSGQFADITSFSGPRLTNYSNELFVSQIITPCFSSEPSLSLINRVLVSIGYVTDIPNWQSSQTAVARAMMIRNGSAFGSMVPETIKTADNILFTESQSGVLENQQPRVVFIIDPATGFTDTNFKFDASASTDLETPAESLKVRWDFEGDDHFDTEFSTTRVVFHTYALPGNYKPVVEVQDEAGSIASKTSSVDVALSSSAPTAYFTVTPESGRISDIFIFDASRCYDSQDATDQLKVRWDFDGDGVWETNWSTRKVEYFVFRNEGTYVTKLEVLDTQGLSGSTTRMVPVLPANIKPTAFYTVSPDSGTTLTRFDFDASGSSDPEDSPENLRVRWDWENDGIFDTEYRTLKTIQHVFPVAGSYTVVLEVIDSELYGATFTRTIEVSNPNVPPVADFSITPTTGTVGEMIAFDASLCTDSEDSLEELEVRWDWDYDNTYDTDFSTEKLYRRSFSEVGTYLIKLQVRDKGGLTDTRVKQIVIR
jgi:PKD repeat protein